MMLTREQAGASWCPMVRTARIEQVGKPGPFEVVGGCNTDALGKTRVPASCRCIADQCAMWRWAEYTTGPLTGKVIDEPALGPGGKRMHFTAEKEPYRGYCGLAGPVMGSAS